MADILRKVVEFFLPYCTRREENFLLYTHLYDLTHITGDVSCKGNHVHLLVQGDFLNNGGIVKKPSQTYHYEWIMNLTRTYKFENPSSTVVKSIHGYLDYLKVYPRNLAAYSKSFIQLAESGYFHATPEKHRANVDEYKKRLNEPDGPPNELSVKKPRLAEADKTFEEIRMYLRESKALNVTDLIRWASQQKNENIKTRLVTQLFRRTNFPQLVEKALNVNKFEQTGGTWYDKLINWSPKKGGYMSIADSITVLKMFHNHNGVPIQSSVRGKSLTQMFDEILSKRLTKINCIVLHGDSNAGKSIVLNSAFKVYPDWGMMYQGITNNFIFEGLEDMEVCIWEEALFSPNQQETIKLVLEGAETSVAAKYRKNVMIPRVPIGITCNVIPWRAILIQAHQTAFVNRCHILQCNEMPALSQYSDAGKIHPQAWLHLDVPYWNKVNGTVPQKQEEESWNWSDDEEGDEALSVLEDCSHHTDVELASDTGSRYARSDSTVESAKSTPIREVASNYYG
ncbi:hypothetical protein OS493_028256 [Desmophyllum pertusum]|uniref:Parvovirus non-structural protein 1 helicase domain-containing protein n=1 Tax=Desmophyllum pertusum TaxID=174260 RepID=A0A9W9YKI0_9CNID|nr:hypothetical protein OS493_028256 [Desmophyllum pertusum]